MALARPTLVAASSFVLALAACSGAASPESTSASAEALVVRKCGSGEVWTCTNEGPMGKAICGCEASGDPAITVDAGPPTPVPPPDFWSQISGGTSRNTCGLVPPPSTHADAIAKLTKIGCTSPVAGSDMSWRATTDGEPLFLCPTSVDAEIPHWASYFGLPACDPTSTGGCEIVYSFAATSNPCNGSLINDRTWEYVWIHELDLAKGKTCESMGCGGGCPVSGDLIPH